MLSQEQKDQFIRRGFVTIERAFSAEVAAKWVALGFERLGLDQNDPRTWSPNRAHPPATQEFDAAEFAPAAWEAMCELMGGAERVSPCHWGDSLIFALGDDTEWIPPSAEAPGWHKDGNFFRHYLDSPEQGLLPIVCWTDLVHRGGSTFIAPDSIKVVAEYLYAHLEGIGGKGYDEPIWGQLISQCHEFIELSAKAGDVVLMHPFMLHAASQNFLRVPRVISNIPVAMREPMRFDRANREDFSPVELAILRALHVERLDYRRAIAGEVSI
jgi:hypothetical protein